MLWYFYILTNSDKIKNKLAPYLILLNMGWK